MRTLLTIAIKENPDTYKGLASDLEQMTDPRLERWITTCETAASRESRDELRADWEWLANAGRVERAYREAS